MLATRSKPLRFTMHAGRWLWNICAAALAVALVVGALTPLTSAQDDGNGARPPAESAVSMGEAQAHMRKRDVHAQVVGGSPVAQGSLSFVTKIAADVGGGLFWHCGGSLITSRHVLTAAHCVEHPEDGIPFDASQFEIGIGQVDLDEVTPANEFGVTAVSQHPGWDPLTFANDVAVLELDRAVPSSLARPITLIGAGNISLDNPGRAVTVAGWGVTTSGGGSLSRELLKADLNVVSDAACDDTFSAPIDFAGVICAGAPAKSSCNGDSGGALFATVTTKAGGKSNRAKAQNQHEVKDEGKKKKKHKKKKHKKKKHKTQTTVTQIGVASFARTGCPPGFAGGYAQLSSPTIRDFIDEALES